MSKQLQFWLRVRRALAVAFVFAAAFGVWAIAIRPASDGDVVLPNTDVQFSLDLEVIGSLDHDVVYVVEQRARPAYRIFAFDPDTGEDTTVFTVPEDAIIYGITLDADRSTLAVAYSPDFEIGGSGLWTLDIDDGTFTEIVAAEPDVYVTEPEWSTDGGSVFATLVDRTGDDEVLSIAQIALADPRLEVVVEAGITPALFGDELYYLVVDDESARRSIGVAGGQAITIGEGDLDLDHLSAGPSGDVHVAVLVPVDAPDGGLGFGTAADAHGNHNVPSVWWALDPTPAPSGLDASVVYDASVSSDGGVVTATLEGLSISNGSERVDVIASRAIRFVAG